MTDEELRLRCLEIAMETFGPNWQNEAFAYAKDLYAWVTRESSD